MLENDPSLYMQVHSSPIKQTQSFKHMAGLAHVTVIVTCHLVTNIVGIE